jgi:hypothetical protein
MPETSILTRTPIRTSDELRDYASTNMDEPVPEAEFRERLSELLRGAPDGVVRHHAFFSLSAAASGGLDTGIELAAGEAVTLFSTAGSRVSVETLAGLEGDRPLLHRLATESAEALRGVWYRVGSGDPARRGTRSTDTIVATAPGRLFLAAAPISNRADQLYEVPSVDRLVLVVQWSGDPLDGLRTLRAGGDVGGLLGCELARQQSEIVLPDGWSYAPPAAAGEQFASDGRGGKGPIIGCYSRSGASVLLTDAALPLLPGTTLGWTWRTHELPSRVREDQLHTHNYISLAVEFDNGYDVTYYWSAELPLDTAYVCPVPGWENRETHVVVRTGHDGLGQWLDEQRDLYADYARYVGEPPGAVSRLWITASTYRGRSTAWCDYGRIELSSGSTRLRVN